jgi:SMC interacting uncharacterized protein involved in chromosome segregation
MRRPQPSVNNEHKYQLEKLHQEIDVIKNNHLVHIAQDIDDLDIALKETKTEINQRFDKLDERLWLVIGLVITTLVGIVVSGIFGA